MDTEVLYEIWQEDIPSGRTYRRQSSGIDDEAFVAKCVARMNTEEASHARTERRKVRTRYFTVKATTTFEEVEA